MVFHWFCCCFLFSLLCFVLFFVRVFGGSLGFLGLFFLSFCMYSLNKIAEKQLWELCDQNGARSALCGLGTSMVHTARNCEKEHVATHKCCRWFYSHAFGPSCCDISHYNAKFSMLVNFPELYPITPFLPVFTVRRREVLLGKVYTGKSILSAAWKDEYTCAQVYNFIFF